MIVRFTIPIRFDDEPHPLDPTATSHDWFDVEAPDINQARLHINQQHGNHVWCSTYPDGATWDDYLDRQSDAGRPPGRCIATLTSTAVICPRCGEIVTTTPCTAVAAS